VAEVHLDVVAVPWSVYLWVSGLKLVDNLMVQQQYIFNLHVATVNFDMDLEESPDTSSRRHF